MITGLGEVPDTAEVTHAGTAARDGAIVTAGGRVLNVTALGHDLQDARRAAYAAADVIDVRRQDPAAGHRRMSRPATETDVATELDGLEVDTPRVGIVMGSKSDMPAMEKAAKELTERGISHEIRVMSAHRDPDMVADYARNAQHARDPRDHRRRGPVRRAAGRRRRPLASCR